MDSNRLQNRGTSAGRTHPVIGSYRLWRSGQAIVFGTCKKLNKVFLPCSKIYFPVQYTPETLSIADRSGQAADSCFVPIGGLYKLAAEPVLLEIIKLKSLRGRLFRTLFVF